MDDILYVILGVIWLAWSLYSNKQKAERKRMEQAKREAEVRRNTTSETVVPPVVQPGYEPVKPVHKSPERSVLEEIFGEYIPQEEADEDTYTPEVDEKSWQRKMADYSASEVQSLEEIKEEIPADYFNKLYDKEYKTVEQQVIKTSEDEEEDTQNTVSQEDFDLKKALIYSEILRAPYISGAA